MTKQNNSIDTYLGDHCFAKGEQEIYLGSCLKVFRNLEQYKFPGKLSSTERKQVLEFVGNALLGYEGFEKPKMFHGESLSPIEKEYLYEYFQGMESFHQAHVGDGFIFDRRGNTLCILNIKEHLCLQSIDPEGDLEKSWMELSEIESYLGKLLKFSFSSKYGYLTANFMRCGCGLKAYTFVQVPALFHLGKLDAVLESINKEKIHFSGMHMSEEGNLGDVVVLSNKVSLGVSEQQIISLVHSATTRLILSEQKWRASREKEFAELLIDKVARAFGLLTCSFQLEIAETLRGISLLKLGVSMGWLKNISLGELNDLFNSSRRAHLYFEEKLSEKELGMIEQHRSDFVKKTLKKAELSI